MLLGRFRNRQPATDSAVVDQDFLDYAATIETERTSRYRLFDRYYRGDHETHLTDRARRYLERAGIPFAENFCETVVDAMADRIELTEVAAVMDDGDAPEVDDYLGRVFRHNRVDARQTTVHTVTLVRGDGFVIVDWDETASLPRLSWNRPENVKVEYADDGITMAWASKRWNTILEGREITRLNVYWPDRVDKWFRLHSTDGAGGWVAWQDGGGPWTVDGAPLGVPVFHFANRALDSGYGFSELHGVVPQQDALNKLILDLNEAADYYSAPQRWATGITTDNDSLRAEAGSLWRAASKDATFGQFDPADLSGLLDAIEQQISRIARRSRSPLHLLTGGDMPSGEALRAAEAGLVAKIQDRETTWGDTWEDAFHLCLKLGAEFGDGPELPEGLALEARWRPAHSETETERLTAAMLKHDLGVSRATLLTELGYDAESEEAQRTAESEQSAAAMQRAFDRAATTRDDEQPGDGERPGFGGFGGR